ncbi:MAG TPA: VOC family protein [Allosphingosinicella sp.]|nr:VOC family protein [Allosphingosinicella sp.]
MAVKILSYDHVGIRVTDAERARAFYATLGFALDAAFSTETAVEMVNASGVRINLILNGVPTETGDNVLLDRPLKWPGYTHAAFVVDRLDDILAWAAGHGVRITEGPVDWGRRLTCFLRDPDSNVLEFNQLKMPPCILVLGQKNYSSWSMRAWLLMRWLGLDFEIETVPLYREDSRPRVRALGGETGLVPVLRLGDLAIWDTLAIFETLHERHGGVWPADAPQRARARSLCGEVHSGFNALREALPVNIRARGRKVPLTPAVEADIERVAAIWSRPSRTGSDWLFGEFGAADIMFAPVATRFQTYGIILPQPASAYQARLLAHPLVASWLALGAAETDTIPSLERGV